MATELKRESIWDFQNRLLQTVVVPKTIEDLVLALQEISRQVHEWAGPAFPYPAAMQQAVTGTSDRRAVHLNRRLNSRKLLNSHIETIEAFLSGKPVQYRKGGMLKYDCGHEMAYPYEAMFLDLLLAQQKLIPGLTTIDIYPPRKLTVGRLRLLRDVQVLRGKLTEVNGRTITDDDRMESVKRLSRKISLKLDNEEANGALARSIAKADPFDKAGVFNILLPSIFYSLLSLETVPTRRRLDRTNYVKDEDSVVVSIAPQVMPLGDYWRWIKNRVTAELTIQALEFEFRTLDTRPECSPELRGTKQGQDEVDAWKRGGRRRMIRSPLNDAGSYSAKRRMAYAAIDEASPDEANFEITADGGFESIELSDCDIQPDEPSYLDIEHPIEGTDPAIESLGVEAGVNPADIVRSVCSGMTKRDRQYLRALSAIMLDAPGMSMDDAHLAVQKKLRITDKNRRQIWFRIKRSAKIAQHTTDLERDALGGHIVLRPDGTEIRLPAWAIGMLRHLQLVLDEPGKPPQLNAGAYLIAGSVHSLAKELVRREMLPEAPAIVTKNEVVHHEAHPARKDEARQVVGKSADLPAACYHGYSQAAMGRLARVLGPDLSGPGERISCRCAKCRPCPQ